MKKLPDFNQIAGTAFLLIALLFFMFTSCATLDKTVEDNENISRLAVIAGTTLVLEREPQWAERMYDITVNAIELFEGDNIVVQVKTLERFIYHQIDWHKLSISQKIMVNEFIFAIKEKLMADGVDIKSVSLIETLQWINYVASMYMSQSEIYPNGSFVWEHNGDFILMSPYSSTYTYTQDNAVRYTNIIIEGGN